MTQAMYARQFSRRRRARHRQGRVVALTPVVAVAMYDVVELVGGVSFQNRVVGQDWLAVPGAIDQGVDAALDMVAFDRQACGYLIVVRRRAERRQLAVDSTDLLQGFRIGGTEVGRRRVEVGMQPNGPSPERELLQDAQLRGCVVPVCSHERRPRDVVPQLGRKDSTAVMS